MSPRDLENAKRKSIGREKIARKVSKVVDVTVQFLIMGTIIIITATGMTLLQKMPDQMKAKEVKTAYVDVVSNHAYMEQSEIKYDNFSNAQTIRESLDSKGIYQEKDILVELYTMYSSMKKSPDRNELLHMNEVLSDLKTMYAGNELFEKFPDKFTQLVANYGFLQKDGSLDMKAYSKAMDELIIKMKHLEEVEVGLEERLRGK